MKFAGQIKLLNVGTLDDGTYWNTLCYALALAIYYTRGKQVQKGILVVEQKAQRHLHVLGLEKGWGLQTIPRPCTRVRLGISS